MNKFFTNDSIDFLAPLNPVLFYAGAVSLALLAAFLMRGTSPFSRAGAREFDRNRTRRTLGVISGLAAGSALAIGVAMQLSLAHP